METGDKVKANEVNGPHRRFWKSNYLPVKLAMCVCTRICDHKISCRFSLDCAVFALSPRN